MKFLIVVTFTASLFAQPTIIPAAATLGPGESVAFHSTAVKPHWVRSGIGNSVTLAANLGTCPVGAKDCVFKSGFLIAGGSYPTTTQVMVYDETNWSLGPSIATITLTTNSSFTASSCSCKDGKDGAVAGDIFIVSNNQEMNATFIKTANGTWTAPAQTSGGFLAFIAIYRNGVRVIKESVISVTLSGSKLVLSTVSTWPASDLVTATWLVAP